MSLLILAGRWGTQYVAGKGLKAIKTKIQTTYHRKEYIQKLAKKQPTNSYPKTNTIYKRPKNATTIAQRKHVQGKPCVDCGIKRR